MMVNKKWVKILKAARKRIESGENAFISSAIKDCNLGINIFGFWYKASLLKEMEKRLRYRVEVHEWLSKYHYGVYVQICDDNQFKEYHLAWIDNMIEEFSGLHPSEFSGNIVGITGTTSKFFGENSGETYNFKSVEGIVFIEGGIR